MKFLSSDLFHIVVCLLHHLVLNFVYSGLEGFQAVRGGGLGPSLGSPTSLRG